jgi:hypothetical protein
MVAELLKFSLFFIRRHDLSSVGHCAPKTVGHYFRTKSRTLLKQGSILQNSISSKKVSG